MGQSGSKTWAEDINQNYTYAMNGTSASTPMVAGTLALVLEACPNLNWRDVKYLIAKHALKIDANNESWVTNAAGFNHSVDYGFGLINPNAMINDCQSDYQALAIATSSIEIFDNINIAIPDNNRVAYEFTIQNDKIIEWIGVNIYSNHSNASELQITLTSPSNKQTRLVLGSNNGGAYNMSSGFRFGTLAFMGETSKGEWNLKIEDMSAENIGDLEKIEFEIFGH
jgi:hypothetical protein